MIITKHSLPRRTFLRGVGASLALPLLDSMVPAFAAVRSSAAKPVPRLFTVVRAERRDHGPVDAGRRRGTDRPARDAAAA